MQAVDVAFEGMRIGPKYGDHHALCFGFGACSGTLRNAAQRFAGDNSVLSSGSLSERGSIGWRGAGQGHDCGD